MNYFKRNGKKLVGYVFAAAFMASVLFLGKAIDAQAVDGSIKAASANIRASANSSSEVLASVKSGDKVDVISSETGADGYTWYKVYVSASATGYIRSDLVTASGTVPASSSSSASSSTASSTTAVAETAVTSMTSQSASIAGSDVRVRKQASTSADVVATVKSGTAITLTGTATGADGKQWYQVNFINNGNNVTGFIRSDFISTDSTAALADDSASADGAETSEETAQADETAADGTDTSDEDLAAIYGDIPTENNDYELKYTADDTGTDTWYLYNNLEGVRMKLTDLLGAMDTNANNVAVMAKQKQMYIIAIIILAVLFLAAAGAAVFFGMKWHEGSQEYEDDEDEDEDVKVARPLRRKILSRREEEDDEDDDEDDEDDEDEAPRRRPTRRPTTQPEQRPVRRQTPVTDTKPVRRVALDANGNPVRRPAVDSQGRPVRRVALDADGNPVRRSAAESQGRPVKRVAPTESRPVRPAAEPVKRPAAKSDANWKSKNFLSEEDDLDFSFINMDDEN